MSNELLTPEQMGRADHLTIAAGTPGIELMEHAGAAIAACVVRLADTSVPVIVFAGPGNNGGDGFVAARLLTDLGYAVSLGLLGTLDKLHGDAALAAQSWTGETQDATTLNLPENAIIIDALFGAGLQRALIGPAANLVTRLNQSALPIIAVDLPSGINGATGTIEGVAIKARETVTFFRAKPGHLLLPGRLHCGPLTIADIGIRPDTLSQIAPNLWQNTPDLWRHAWLVPASNAHKYARGHTIVVSGPSSQTGAARLAAASALRAGSGLVTLATRGSAMMVNASHLTTIMLAKIDAADAFTELLADKRLNSIVIGPGCGISDYTKSLTLAALQAGCACTLDADALSCFAEDRDTLTQAIAAHPDRAVTLTPHGGEFARLFPDISATNKLDQARQAAKISGATIVLKGADTIIASPDGRAAINANAPPWLATAGSGDCLAGFIAGLQAQSMPAFEAAAMGVWLHGEAGNAAGIGLIATDLPDQLPAIFSGLLIDLEQ